MACSRYIWLQMFPAEVVFHQPLKKLCPLFSPMDSTETVPARRRPINCFQREETLSSAFTSTAHSQALPKSRLRRGVFLLQASHLTSVLLKQRRSDQFHLENPGTSSSTSDSAGTSSQRSETPLVSRWRSRCEI